MRIVIDTNIIVSAYLGGELETVLEAAVIGKADYLVSGDKHLLELKTFRSIPILSAREFIKRLKMNNTSPQTGRNPR